MAGIMATVATLNPIFLAELLEAAAFDAEEAANESFRKMVAQKSDGNETLDHAVSPCQAASGEVAICCASVKRLASTKNCSLSQSMTAPIARTT